jgi:hypothetical protein
VFYGGVPAQLGIENITQAYGSWRPVEGLNLDLGMFGTIFGAEVLESWNNLNYTRGGLYYGMQPFWHTGLRGRYDFTDQFALTAMVVNGVNNVFDDEGDGLPSLALQVGIAPNDMFSMALGGLFALDGETDGSGFDRFFDLVATLNVDAFTLVFNGDYNMNVQPVGDNTSFFGLSLAAGYAFTDMFGVALRGEYLSDSDNALYAAVEDVGPDMTPGTADDVFAEDTSVITGTLTLDFKPIPDRGNLVIRWDNRIETSNRDIYFNSDAESTDMWMESVLGLVVHSGE